MTGFIIVGEDELCCALGVKLLQEIRPDCSLAAEIPPINTRGVNKLAKELPRYLQIARNIGPVLCIADSDRNCAPSLLQQWLPHGGHPHLLLRIAVHEAESWVLADQEEFSRFLKLTPSKLPHLPDTLPDPKQHLLNLVRQGKNKYLRQDMISERNNNKPGTGYVPHLTTFVREHWSARRAERYSPSLARAVQRLQELNM